VTIPAVAAFNAPIVPPFTFKVRSNSGLSIALEQLLTAAKRMAAAEKSGQECVGQASGRGRENEGSAGPIEYAAVVAIREGEDRSPVQIDGAACEVIQGAELTVDPLPTVRTPVPPELAPLPPTASVPDELSWVRLPLNVTLPLEPPLADRDVVCAEVKSASVAENKRALPRVSYVSEVMLMLPKLPMSCNVGRAVLVLPSITSGVAAHRSKLIAHNQCTVVKTEKAVAIEDPSDIHRAAVHCHRAEAVGHSQGSRSS